MSARPLGLYVHIPFCAAICNYCNFNRGLFEGAQKDRYLSALLTEIRRAPDEPGPGLPPERAGGVQADTVFLGGGTPSLLTPDEIAAILDACRESFELKRDAEVTLEANPETVARASLEGYRRAGVTRLSFGVQSFRDEELRRLSRAHDVARVHAAYQAARASGFDNISLDLMMWLPGQQVSEWLESVDAAAALGPEHLSLYLLEVYPNAPLKDEMARARWSQAPDDDAADMYLQAMARLEAAGFEQYEISNVARNGRRSCHNLKYWCDGEWRGFGCGAHSTRHGIRWKNVSAIDEYVARLAEPGRQSVMTDIRRMADAQRLGEALFTGLRLTDGVDLDVMQERYGVDVWSRYGDQLEFFVDAGILVHDPSRLRLTRRGMLLAHEVMAVFV